MSPSSCLPWYSSRSSTNYTSMDIGVCLTPSELACLSRVEPILDEASESAEMAETAVLLGVKSGSRNE